MVLAWETHQSKAAFAFAGVWFGAIFLKKRHFNNVNEPVLLMVFFSGPGQNKN
jgi:hypothetical protein